MELSDERISEIRARVDVATAGPWHLAIYCDERGEDERFANIESDNQDIAYQSLNDDAAFIAAARTDVPDLLDALAASQTRVAELEAALEILERMVTIHETTGYWSGMEQARREYRALGIIVKGAAERTL